jgi:hypothetical protein
MGLPGMVSGSAVHLSLPSRCEEPRAAIFSRTRTRYVEPAGSGWIVRGEIGGGGSGTTAFQVKGGLVILAAGTLGSTELLLRSREKGLAVSQQLGSRFSANGDMIRFAYNTGRNINGIGTAVSSTMKARCSAARFPGDVHAGLYVMDGSVVSASAYLTRTAAKRPGASFVLRTVLAIEAWPKEVLDQPSVRSLVGESVTRGMPQHVGMDVEADADSFACPLHNAGDHIGRQWATPL